MTRDPTAQAVVNREDRRRRSGFWHKYRNRAARPVSDFGTQLAAAVASGPSPTLTAAASHDEQSNAQTTLGAELRRQLKDLQVKNARAHREAGGD